MDEAERDRFILAAKATSLPLRSLCLTLVYTGCRISEALAITPDALMFDEGVIAFRCLKKRGVVVIREVPAPPELFDDLLAHAAACACADEPLWSWGRCRAWQLVKNLMLQAQIRPGPHATAKGLRHAYGLHAIRRGVPLNFVQRWLGHASVTTTAIYLQAVGPDECAIASRMWS